MAPVEHAQARTTFGSTRIVHGGDRDRRWRIRGARRAFGLGKSSLLRLIYGLGEITEGEGRIGERVITHVPPKLQKWLAAD